MKTLQTPTSQRTAFTLLELLIVVAIIAILMGMSVVVMSSFVEQAEVEATSATIQKLTRLIEQRSEAIERAFPGPQQDAAEAAVRGLLATGKIFGVYNGPVTILARKSFYRFNMPQHFEERILFENAPALTVPGLPNSVYNAVAAPLARKELGLPDTTPLTDPAIDNLVTQKLAKHDPVTESSEMLYFALISSGTLGATSVDLDRFTAAEIRDTDEDGLPEFVDAWEQPLRFYRWPTRLVDWNPPVPFAPDLADESDPTDVIVTVDTNNDGTPDTTIGQREVTKDERAVANILLKGLPPAPSLLPNGALPRDLLLTDPDDPVGILYSELERLDGLDGRPLFSTHFNETNYHTPDTYHAPIVVSAGPDETLGLYEPQDVPNFGHLGAYNPDLNGNGTTGEAADFALLLDIISDNLTSRNRRAGGR